LISNSDHNFAAFAPIIGVKIAIWIEIGNLSVAADKSYPKLWPQRDFLAALFQEAIWSFVPSFGSDARKSVSIKCNGLSKDCVQTSTIANTLTFPAASTFLDNCPTEECFL
jgi:hypothetical protein